MIIQIIQVLELCPSAGGWWGGGASFLGSQRARVKWSRAGPTPPRAAGLMHAHVHICPVKYAWPWALWGPGPCLSCAPHRAWPGAGAQCQLNQWLSFFFFFNQFTRRTWAGRFIALCLHFLICKTRIKRVPISHGNPEIPWDNTWHSVSTPHTVIVFPITPFTTRRHGGGTSLYAKSDLPSPITLSPGFLFLKLELKATWPSYMELTLLCCEKLGLGPCWWDRHSNPGRPHQRDRERGGKLCFRNVRVWLESTAPKQCQPVAHQDICH